MNNAELIDRLCGMLAAAAEIIKEQSDLLSMHGIGLPPEIQRKADAILEATEGRGIEPCES